MALLLVALVLLALAALLVLAGNAAAAPPAPIPRPDLTPREFEHHCADLLAARGWRVTLGRGSADQGVDVLARKGGRSLVLQCKLYTRPVGNRAVQEALAGRGYAGADAAAVVSNASYTPAAHALAARVGVMLLHVSDLAGLDLSRDGPPQVPAARVRRPRRAAPAAVVRGAAIPAGLLAAAILLLPLPPAAPHRPEAALPLPLPPPPRHATR